MSIQQQLLDLGDLFNLSDLSTFTENVPLEWVASALELSASAGIGRRRPPSDQVLWLVLGMALFRDEPVHEVARRLSICARGLASQDLLAGSGVNQARQRLGADPVEALFQKTGAQWGCERYEGDDWDGLQVFSVDGALLRTADTRELREHFGSGNTGTERQTPFPMMRLVALMNVRSHVLVDAPLSPYRRVELPLAETFLDKIPEHSVTLLDKGFWGADFLSSLAGQGKQRHWLTPARKNIVAEEVIRYGSNDRLLRMRVSPQARKKNPALPTHWDAREIGYQRNGKTKDIMTSLPADRYGTEAVAALYEERWEIELGFRDIKSSMQHNAVALLSKEIELVYQEVWGCYWLTTSSGVRPAKPLWRSDEHRQTYVSNLHASTSPCSSLSSRRPTPCRVLAGGRLSQLRSGLGSLFLDHRPRPSRPRTMKISKTRYPVDRKAAPLE